MSRPLFVGSYLQDHVVGSRPMERKKTMCLIIKGNRNTIFDLCNKNKIKRPTLVAKKVGRLVFGNILSHFRQVVDKNIEY